MTVDPFDPMSRKDEAAICKWVLEALADDDADVCLPASWLAVILADAGWEEFQER